MATQTRMFEAEVEVCDRCGDEMFTYEPDGKEPRAFGFANYFETDDGQKICVPKCKRKYIKEQEETEA